MFYSIALIGIATYLLRRFGSGRWLSWTVASNIFLLCLLSAVHLGMWQITGEGMNSAVFYHLGTGLEGGDITQYAAPAAYALLFLITVAVSLWLARKQLRPGSQERRRGRDLCIAALAITGILLHPVIIATVEYKLRFELVSQQEEGFVTPQVNHVAPESPRNLVILYLESLERTYMDAEHFPDLTPNLTKLESRAISFSDIGQTTGSGFTIGGMVATQCGFPLIIPGGANSMRVSRFLNGATCMGDILNEAGYRLSYLGGASTQFAGKGSFYRSHGYQEVSGLEELLPLLPDADYRAEWGLQDDSLFDLASEKFNQLASNDAPFVLTLLTLDTHHPNGHADTNRDCAGLVYEDGSNPMLNSVLCADKMAGEFVEEILEGPHGDNTVIAVMSDHLAMVNSASSRLNEAPRRNLLMLLDRTSIDSQQKIDRTGSTLDVAPTILRYLGFDIERMGLGVNLLGSEQTLPERLGVSADSRNALDSQVLGYQSTYSRLWAFPSLSEGLYLNAELGEVNFGYSAFKTPALFTLDKSNNVTSALLGEKGAAETLSEAAMELSEDTFYLWFDSCQTLTSARGEASEHGKTCALAGRRGTGLRLHKFDGSGFLSADVVTSLLDISADETLAIGDLDDSAYLESIGRARGEIPLQLPVRGLETKDRGILVQSASFGSGASFIRRQTTNSLEAGEDWVLSRGITLAGVNSDGSVELLDRIDQCNTAFNAEDQTPWISQIFNADADFIGHVVTVHDTAFCGNSSEVALAPLYGLHLPVLKSAKMRQPYVAVIDNALVVREFTNTNFDRVSILLSPSDAQDYPVAYPIILQEQHRQTENESQSVPSNSRVAANSEIPITPVSTLMPSPCLDPTENPLQASVAVLEASTRYAGADLTNVIAFREGWWGEEGAGRWSGSRRSKFAITLPVESNNPLLTLDLASPSGKTINILVEHDGRRLAESRINGDTRVTFSAETLPQGSAAELTVVLEEGSLDCPGMRTVDGDPRRLGIMLKSISLDAAPTEIAKLSDTEATRVETGCLLASKVTENVYANSVIPIGQFISVADAMQIGALALGRGWWNPEIDGTWTGRHEARVSVILPKDEEYLRIELNLAPLGEIEQMLELVFDGQIIARQNVGSTKPMTADVSELPRGVPLLLELTIPGLDPLGCPISRSLGDDARAMGVMLKSLRLSTNEELPFSHAIGHGGGRFGAAAITNSFEAIEANLLRYSVFEIDFSWTSDNELVCLHDWDEAFTSRFKFRTHEPTELQVFMSLLANSSSLPRNCDLDGLAGWMRANPDVRIVTDVKERPGEAHQFIATRHPDLITQFVPQAFHPDEISQYRKLGYKDVIWTLYRFGDDPNAVVREAIDHVPSAITMPLTMAQSGLLREVRSATEIPVYVHTLNNPEDVACVLNDGAAGIYSDDLSSADVAALKDTNQVCL